MAEEWMHDPEARTVAAVRRVLVRDLKTLAEELRAYPSDEAVWRTAGTIANSSGTLARLKDADLAGEYPLPLNGESIGTTHFMVHLAAHFAYHLGQVNYHRRLIGG